MTRLLFTLSPREVLLQLKVKATENYSHQKADTPVEYCLFTLSFTKDKAMNSKRLFIFIMLCLIISCELLDFTEGFLLSCRKPFRSRRCPHKKRPRRHRQKNRRGPSKKGRGDLNPTNNWVSAGLTFQFSSCTHITPFKVIRIPEFNK